MSELSDQATKARRVKASEVQLGQEIILPEFVGVITESHEEDYEAREDRPGHWCLVLEGGEAAEVDRDATIFVLEGVPGDEQQPDTFAAEKLSRARGLAEAIVRVRDDDCGLREIAGEIVELLAPVVPDFVSTDPISEEDLKRAAEFIKNRRVAGDDEEPLNAEEVAAVQPVARGLRRGIFSVDVMVGEGGVWRARHFTTDRAEAHRLAEQIKAQDGRLTHVEERGLDEVLALLNASVARSPGLDGDGDSVTDQFLVTITTAGDSPAISESDLADVLGEVDQVPGCGQWAFHIQHLPAGSVARAPEVRPDCGKPEAWRGGGTMRRPGEVALSAAAVAERRKAKAAAVESGEQCPECGFRHAPPARASTPEDEQFGDVVLSARIPAADLATLQARAAEADRTLSAEIRHLLRGYLHLGRASTGTEDARHDVGIHGWNGNEFWTACKCGWVGEHHRDKATAYDDGLEHLGPAC